MNISYSDIYKLCSYETSFYKGMAYHNGGCVKKLNRTKINSFEDYIEARVKGTHMYNVTIWCEEGRVSKALCDCRAFEKYDGICKHIAAVLFSCIPKKEDVHTLKEKNNFSSSVATEIINNYKNIENRKTTLPSDAKTELYPILHLCENNRCSVEFKIGLPKKYIIKDLCDFAENIKHSKEASYGKNAVFMHNINLFSKKSREYIRLICDAAEENSIFNRVYNKYSYLSELKGRTLELTPRLLDNLMEISKGGELTISVKENQRSVTVTEKNPRFSFNFSQGSGNTVFVKTDKYMHLCGADRLYIISDNEIMMTTPDYKEKMEGIVTAGKDGTSADNFTVSEADMIYFYNTIIPQISVYSNIIAEGIDLSKYEMPAPEVRFYIDCEGMDEISAKCEIMYGEKAINPFASKEMQNQSFRDNNLELGIKGTMQRYFSSSDVYTGEFFISDNEDLLFDLAYRGIDELRSMGEVFVSDSFKRLSIHPAPKISVGLSLSSDLLELDFFSDEFDLRELRNLLKSFQSKKKYHRLSDGSFLTLDDSKLSALAETADSLNLFDFSTDNENADKAVFALPRYRALYLDKLLGGNTEVSRSFELRSLIRNIKTAEDSAFEAPESLRGILRTYQKHGFRWLKTMDAYGFGGILADDMGLGKTLQIIALLLSEKEASQKDNKQNIPSLIVCPASLVYNWETEILKFAPDLTVMTVTGSTDERSEKISEWENFDILITSYDLLKRDFLLYKDKTFRFQIIDEAQYIKNHSTQSAKAAKTIHAQNRFALTGTPIENRLSELWSIFDFLMPGLLFSYSRFRKEMEQPAVKDGDMTALERIKNMVSPFILRRLKADVLKELPEKSEHIFLSRMGEEQKKAYAANVKALKDTLEKNPHSSIKEDTVRILAMLTRLRQLCCDPSLCYDNYSGGSAKLEGCIDLINEAIEGGHKVLLFSQFTSMLEIIESRLEEEGIRYYTLTGQTPKEQRLSLVNSFQTNDVPVFLISLKAGGTGLNLTSADVVIHYDPWWNIAAQNQATDRTHRIGQKNHVTVYKLIAKNTIEEKILDLQKNKKDLADSIISENGINIAEMTKEELISLLGSE